MPTKDKKQSAKGATLKRSKFTVKRKKARSVKEWIRGIEAGTLEKQVNTYYDNIKEHGLNIEIKDPQRMTRIQLLEESNRLEQALNDIAINSITNKQNTTNEGEIK